MDLTAITVLTCPRPEGADYLPATLASLDAAGAGLCGRERYVVASEWTWPRELRPGWTLINHARASNLEGTWNAFRLFLNLGGERLIYCEDDIELVDRAVDAILETEVPESAALVDFHDTRQLPTGHPDGLYHRAFAACTKRQYIGNQCMLLPRRTVEWLVDHDPCAGARHQDHSQADVVLGRLLETSPWPEYLIRVPALARHVGEVSAAHHGMGLGQLGRLPTNYRGTV